MANYIYNNYKRCTSCRQNYNKDVFRCPVCRYKLRTHAHNNPHRHRYEAHNTGVNHEYNHEMTTKQDVQKQIKDLESQINTTSDQNEKRNLESQRDSLKQQLENL